MKKSRRYEPVGPLALIEEAVYVMRTAPWTVLAPYYIGSLPFVLALLFFWTDMSHGAFAESRLATGSFGVALAFVWMKAWQSIFARSVHDFVTGAPPARRSFRRLLRIAAIQGFHHALGLIALPLSLIAIIPFPWVFAYYQNLTVYGDLDEVAPEDITAEARRQAPAWPLQNVAIIWLLSPFLLIVGLVMYSAVLPIVNSVGGDGAQFFAYFYAGIFILAVAPLSPMGAIIAFNLNIAVSLLPMLANMWFGVETPFTQALMRNNTTTWAMVCGLAFLIMDPALKTAYTLRCFYSQSRRTGGDLEVALRRARNRVGVGILLLVAATFATVGTASAQDEQAGGFDASQLDSAIQETLQQREYAWRLPREYAFENPVASGMVAVLEAVAERVVNTIRSIWEWTQPLRDWIRGLFRGRGEASWIGGGITGEGLRVTLLGAAAVLALALGAYLLRRWYTGRASTVEVEMAEAVAPPDLEDENVTADAMPGDEWLALADDLIAKGDRRLAVRALFLAGLARLGENGLINLARYKSNLDYVREVGRRAHAAPDHAASFQEMVGAFERVWYGAHAVADDLIDAFRKHLTTVGTRV